VLVVGLTGGIGSGKSAVAELLAARGAIVLDADAIAREVVEPGRPALAAIAERFGPAVVRPDGSLDRPALASVAFVDDESRRALEAITHPAIDEEFTARMADAPEDAIVVCDVPLLVESDTGRNRRYDVVVVVETPVEIRLERLAARGMDAAEARRRMAMQATDEERRAVATYLIDNSRDRSWLDAEVERVWQDLLRRSSS
jgi:dephospho-CoA kinase